jgi:hypothetical protein
MALCLENIINDKDDDGYKLDILNISMGCLSCGSVRIMKILE